MRFIIGCNEICGLIKTYSEELKKQGHSVITISDKNPFFNYKYDYSLTNLKYDYFNNHFKNGLLKKVVFKIFEFIEKIIPSFRLYSILLLIIRRVDVYIYIWKGFVPDQHLFRILKFFKVKIIVLFLGDDVRNFTALSQEFDITPWTFPDDYTNKSIEDSIMKLRYVERDADIIYSVPDQMGFATRPYFHLHLPLYTSDYYFKNHFRVIPVVLHLPSEPFIKGSNIIMKVLEELKEEGLKFEVIYKSKIPHEEVKQLLSNVDILVDEIILHGPGVLALEAMASGCAVATNHLIKYSEVFNPPICQIDYKNIKERVRELIINYDYRQELIIKGYNYALENCNPTKIVSGILSDLKDSNKKTNYLPSFYRDRFIKPVKFKGVFENADKIYYQ